MEEDHPRLSIRKIYTMVRPFIGASAWGMLFFIFLALLGAVLALAEPFLYGRIVDALINSLNRRAGLATAWNVVIPFLILWIGVIFGQIFLNAIGSFLRWHVNNAVSNRFTTELHRRILRLDIRRFHEMHSGEILRRFDNAWDACWQILERLQRDYIAAFLLIVVAIVVGAYMDWRLTMIAVVPMPLILGVGYFNLRRTEPGQRRVAKQYEALSGMAGDAYANIATVKSFIGEERSARELWRGIVRAYRDQMRVNYFWAGSEAFNGAVYTAGRLAIFLFGSWFVLSGTMTVGTLITFLGILSFLFGAMSRIADSLMEVSRSLVRLQRATVFWNEVPAVKDTPRAIAGKRMRGDVTFDHVSYGYHDGHAVLRDVSFRIPIGKTVALIGESGAGKSTLAQLLMRFHDPTSGSVIMDGRDLRAYALASLRKNIGFVMQENLLFHDSIINNILYAKPNASRKEAEQAARQAQAHAFITGLRHGYETVVGERGVKLSGGEKQRIALARVFLADPPVLVLDEATSALDSKTEHALQQALVKVMERRTTLVIAHRLSTVMRADQILVMDRGRIVDRGTHEQLLARAGLYREYWRIQAGGYA